MPKASLREREKDENFRPELKTGQIVFGYMHQHNI